MRRIVVFIQELAFSKVTRLRMSYSLLAVGVIPEVLHEECGVVARAHREERTIAKGTSGTIEEVIKLVNFVKSWGYSGMSAFLQSGRSDGRNQWILKVRFRPEADVQNTKN